MFFIYGHETYAPTYAQRTAVCMDTRYESKASEFRIQKSSNFSALSNCYDTRERHNLHLNVAAYLSL